ncbi:LysR family transcriptional regulator [Acetobacter senegalensis]|uniref:LysR family transcriptional regulator n=1 Tax=Acetobacter senegalensis TaxID=446692 RepID=UPI0013F8A2DB|nr:LysR substrate-binding domain-containing protein [Acetobacter senegalensis]MCG4258384.1 LysR family transcriptional regulator [Acetobacter senegalensis]MCG4261516.1 LysR family transcriptional regulator [Acetobacter senegalensis]MCG4268310.1 LysR family transcriptional regulator [Acetobacter senegalensis]MCG4273537.1 LysR family transcriptional regulator [Acetobacter senegalensis]MCP1194800.1 LysR substrate-binding domain-containing protein [Acetobacter senegalensis]
MFLRQLTYLLALDRFHHFSRAAEACGVSQPALSAGIRQLEAELGITIIQRNRRFYGLTAEGERVLAWARQTLAALDGLRQEAALAQDVAGGSLAIGVIPAAIQVVPLLLERFRAVVPALHVEVKICSSRDMVHLLREHTLQLGLMYLDQVPADSPFETSALYAEVPVLAAAKSMPLPAAKTIEWKDIAAVPLCLFTTEMRSRQLVDAGFRNAGVKPTILLETNALELLHAELLSGRLASILPVAALPERVGPEGLQTRRIGPSASPDVGLVRLDQSNGTALLERVWSVVRALKLDDIYMP